MKEISFNDLPQKDQKKIIRGAMKYAKKEQDKVLNGAHVISNISLHNKLDGSQYVGWLLNKAQSNKKEVLYFEDCYGGHWKLQKLKK